MNPSLFKHRITFLKANISEDELGQEEILWSEYKSLRAMIKTIKGTEYYVAATTQNENTYRFITWYTTGISPDLQIRFKDRVFDIESVTNDDEANKTLTIIAKERV